MNLFFKILFSLITSYVMGYCQEWVVPLEIINGDIYVKAQNQKETIIFKRRENIILISENKEIQINNIESLKPFKEGKYLAKKSNQWGLYDINKQDFIIPAVYDSITPLSGINAFIVEKYGGTATVDINNNIISPYSIHNKTGLIKLPDGHYAYSYNWRKKWLFFPEDLPFTNNNKPERIVVFKNHNKLIKYFDSDQWNLFDKNNSLIKKISYSVKIDKIYRNFCIVKENELYGAMDFNGNIIVPIIKKTKKCPEITFLIKYDRLKWKSFRKILKYNIFNQNFENYSYITESFYRVKKDSTWFVYDAKTGKFLVNNIKSATQTKNRLIITKKDSCFLYDKNGNYIKSIFGKFYRILSYDRFTVKRGDKTMLIDKSGNIFYSFTTGDFKIYRISSYFIIIKKGRKPYKYFDTDNNEIDPEKIDFEIKNRIGDNFIIQKNDKYGIIDKKLKKIVPAIYDNITKKTDKLVLVKLNDKKGLIRIIK